MICLERLYLKDKLILKIDFKISVLIWKQDIQNKLVEWKEFIIFSKGKLKKHLKISKFQLSWSKLKECDRLVTLLQHRRDKQIKSYLMKEIMKFFKELQCRFVIR